MNRFAMLLIPAILFGGCYNPFDPPDDIVASNEPPSASLLAPAPTAPPLKLPSPFSVTTALQYAWRSHPSMIRHRHLILARHGYKVQAALWPNPVVGGAFQEEPGKKTRGIVSIAQKFEIGGKADARVSLAAANIFLAETELLATWSALRADIKEAFVRLAYARSYRTLAGEMATAEKARLDLTVGLFKAGKASEAQTLKLARQAARAKSMFDQSEHMVSDAARSVLIAVGQTPSDNTPELTCTMNTDSPLAGDFESLRKASDATNPQLKTAMAQTAVAQASLRLAKTKRWSDLTVGMSYYQTHYDMDSDGGSIRMDVSAPLPIWDRNQGNIAAAGQDIAASERQQRIAALNAARRLSQLFSKRQQWLVEIRSLDETIIPAASRELKLIRTSLGGGKASKLDVIKLHRELMSLDLQKLEMQLMASVATIELENIVGLTAGGPNASKN
jgi:outer membrane protein, heavy metal efflux system